MKHTKILLMLFICLSVTAYSQEHKVLKYLKSISGKQIVAGQHNREPNARPSQWTDSLYKTTGKYPALWSGDFLFQAENIGHRWTMIREAEKQWNNGAIVQIMLHTCPPVYGEPCEWEGGVLSRLSDEQWEELITEGTALNYNWKQRLDQAAIFLQYLKDKGVEVLFRPLHEMNQGLFWWGGRKGPKGTAELYRQTHDYLTKEKGLTNLIWVWDMQDIDRTWAEYNPGDGYWDILAFDVYDKGYSQDWYEYALSIAGDKPLAIGECSVIPTPEQLEQQPRYVFFMPWAELIYSSNSVEQIKALYDSPKVITLDELPEFK
jgi:mannan endo-1,4-beta-mannosidase